MSKEERKQKQKERRLDVEKATMTTRKARKRNCLRCFDHNQGGARLKEFEQQKRKKKKPQSSATVEEFGTEKKR